MLPAGERILASGSVQLPRFTLLESGSLLVSPARISDAGTYACLATNSRGVDEASADLVVWGECAPSPASPRRAHAHPAGTSMCPRLSGQDASPKRDSHTFIRGRGAGQPGSADDAPGWRAAPSLAE